MIPQKCKNNRQSFHKRQILCKQEENFLIGHGNGSIRSTGNFCFLLCEALL